MHNKAPLWNEGSQVYQLDFGGRVTQESAKNFQIEYSGKQVSPKIFLIIDLIQNPGNDLTGFHNFILGSYLAVEKKYS